MNTEKKVRNFSHGTGTAEDSIEKMKQNSAPKPKNMFKNYQEFMGLKSADTNTSKKSQTFLKISQLEIISESENDTGDEQPTKNEATAKKTKMEATVKDDKFLAYVKANFGVELNNCKQ